MGRHEHTDIEVEVSPEGSDNFDSVDGSAAPEQPQVRYAGFVPASDAWRPARVAATLPAAEFFARFVATRTPVVVTGSVLAPHSVFAAPTHADAWAVVDALLAKVGAAEPVEVESRADKGRFGTGRRRRIVRFGDLVDAMKSGDDSVYMSTQYLGDDGEEEEDEEEEEEEGEEEEEQGEEEDDDDAEDDDDDAMDEEGHDEDHDHDHGHEHEHEHEHGDGCCGGDDEEDDMHDATNENLLESFNDFCKAPLPRVLNDIPLRPELLSTLIPQQLNLWMGVAPPEGISSGLHHDFADNLYILVQGSKRITLIPPSAAPDLDLVGHADLQVVHENGLISYDWSVGSDGSFAADVARWQFKTAIKEMREGLKEAEEGKEVDLEELRKAVVEAKEQLELAEEEEQDVADALEEDEEDDDNDDDDEEPLFKDLPIDDEDGDIEMDVDKLQDDYDEEEDNDEDVDEDEPPFSFSRIDPDVLHSADATKTYPNLKNVTKITFDLKEGEMLYLPASWFHEVRSSPSPNSKTVGPHLALNYWFHPPNALNPDDFENPYRTDFWADQWDALEDLITKDSRPARKNNSAKGWNKLVRSANGEFVVSETADKEEEEVEKYETFDDVPAHLKLSWKNPGAWFMRSKKTGMFMGRAKQATRY
ncbi:cupin-like domain-containing protein [Obelidium mucronatum]|nr:cupin-like domain-containing protein [Obelidium mucronatum]